MIKQKTKDQLKKILLDDKLKRGTRVSSQDLYNIISIACGVYGWSLGANVGTRNITAGLWELDDQDEK